MTAFFGTPQDDVTFDDVLFVSTSFQFVTDDVTFDDSPTPIALGTFITDDVTFDEILSNTTYVVDDVTFDDVVLPNVRVFVIDIVEFQDIGNAALGETVQDDSIFDDTPLVLLRYAPLVVDDITFDDSPVSQLTEFPRTILPQGVSDLWHPGALKDMSISGLLQLRATKMVGWSWRESWGPLKIRDVDQIGLMAYIKDAWNRGIIFDITHALTPGSGIAPNGLGTFGITVSGASQSGEALITTGWPGSTLNCVRSGDVIKIVGDDAVYLVSSNADSNGSGAVTIPINPNLRSSPTNGAQVITTGVAFKATIMELSTERSKPPFQFDGMDILIAEALS